MTKRGKSGRGVCSFTQVEFFFFFNSVLFDFSRNGHPAVRVYHIPNAPQLSNSNKSNQNQYVLGNPDKRPPSDTWTLPLR